LASIKEDMIAIIPITTTTSIKVNPLGELIRKLYHKSFSFHPDVRRDHC